MGAALAIVAVAQSALDRISDMRTLAGTLEVNADVPLLVLPRRGKSAWKMYGQSAGAASIEKASANDVL
jgi:hypothetical protein